MCLIFFSIGSVTKMFEKMAQVQLFVFGNIKSVLFTPQVCCYSNTVDSRVANIKAQLIGDIFFK